MKMKTMFAIHYTSNDIVSDSDGLVAVCTSLDKAVELLKEAHKKPYCEGLATNDWIEDAGDGYPAVEQENRFGWHCTYAIKEIVIDDWWQAYEL